MTRRRAHVIVAVTLALVGAACAAATLPRPRPPTGGDDAGRDSPGDDHVATDAEREGPVDAAALRETLAPGMRELEHRSLDVDGGAYVLAPTDVDRCYRIALVASTIVDVSVTDDAAHVLASARGRMPALGARGPFCLRKGQRATLAVQGASSVDLIVWTAP